MQMESLTYVKTHLINYNSLKIKFYLIRKEENSMNGKKFEITIKCKKCGTENNVFISGWSQRRYDDCDEEVKLNITCNVCRNEESVEVD